MKVYVSHSSSFDYQNGLYAPLVQQFGDTVEFYFPHDEIHEGENSREAIRSSDLVLAEVSYPSTGQGIELGWANDANVPILCINAQDQTPSSALKLITTDFIEYTSTSDLLDKLNEKLK